VSGKSHKRVLFILWIAVLFVLAVGSPVMGQGDEPLPPQGLRPDAPPYAVHGPYAVGTRDFVIDDAERPLSVTVWYPALNPDGVAEAVTYNYVVFPDQIPVTSEGHALLDAAPDASGGPYPLIIFSHGHLMYRQQSTYLTEHLASWGFVVMAADHFGNTTIDMNETNGDTDPAFNYYRPVDVEREIDYAGELAVAGGALEGMIDTSHVGVTGHSFGGLTALQAGGAGLDFDYFRTACEENPEGACPVTLASLDQLAALAGLDAVPQGPWPPFMTDDRVKAIVPLAPAGMRVGPQGAATVTVPTLMLAGSADTMARPEFHTYPVYEGLGSSQKALVVLGGAGHLLFFDTCKVTPWMVDFGLFFLCSDSVWDMDRAHDLVNHFSTAFLLATLKGDTDAAAALAPEAVQFPGITYETTGF
jgi:predicted dienelactone hydrolase